MIKKFGGHGNSLKRRSLCVVAMLTTCFVLTGNAAFAVTRWVNDDDPNGFAYTPPGTSCNNPGYPTIQGAVTAAASGDTIVVCPGMYPENVTITLKSLRVIGFGAGVSIVRGVIGTPGPIFDVLNSGNVTIEGLTVDPMSLQAGGVVWGIRYNGTNGAIKNVAVLNIRNASGASQGLGIRIEGTPGPTKNVLIENNLVQNFTRVGINGNFAGVNLEVRNNSVIGPVLPKVWAPNGIQISRGATAQVTGNTVRDTTSPAPPAGAGSGIILFCGGPTKISGNRVSNSDLGIAVSDNQRGRVKENVVRDSVFEAYSVQYIGTLFGPLGCPMFPSPTRENVFEDNLGINNGEHGIALASFDPNSPVPPTMNDFLRNFIRDSGVDGIRVFGPTGGVDNRFIGNSIAVSGEHDCHDDTVGLGTAGTANTWQNNQGTTSQPPGLCRDDDDGEEGEDEEDDDDHDEDGERDDHDEDDDNDGKHDEEDEDDDNDGERDGEDEDDDNDGIHDEDDDKSTRQMQRTSAGTVGPGEYTDYTMTAEPGALLLTSRLEGMYAEFLRLEIYDPVGLLVGTSPPAIGGALMKVPVPLPGTYTVRVRNIGVTPVDYIARLIRTVPWP